MNTSVSHETQKYLDEASRLVTAADAPGGTHPHWCDFGTDCSDPDGIAIEHAGHVTSFYPNPDDRRVTLKLVHHAGTG